MTSPYLDRPILPLAVALPQMLAKTEAELSTATEPAEKQWLRQRAELIRGLLAPRQSPGLAEVLRRDRTLGQGRRRHGPWVWRTSRPLPVPPQHP
jgi:hypothetical protein